MLLPLGDPSCNSESPRALQGFERPEAYQGRWSRAGRISGLPAETLVRGEDEDIANGGRGGSDAGVVRNWAVRRKAFLMDAEPEERVYGSGTVTFR